MAREMNRGIKKRIMVVEVILFVLVVFLGLKAVEIQIVKSVDLTQKAKKDYTGHILLKGKRGEILDRQMNRLGTSTDALSVAASPTTLENPVQCSRSLASVLNLSRKNLQKKLTSKKRFVWIKKRISPKQAKKIKALGIKGIFFKNDVIRFYPNRSLAAQVTGFTGSEGKGLEGLEYKYESILEGKEARVSITKDGNGRRFDTEERLQKRYSGDSLVLSLDRTIQYITECALKEAVEENRAASGMALVMRPGTGELLAMAHYPEFNPNAYSKFEPKRWRNRAVTDPFEPGSTMKVFLAATAMEEGLCTPSSIFFCENGKYKVGRFTVHDTHEYGWLTLHKIIKFSSNIGAVKVSEVTGKQVLHDALASFGFGQKTKVGCPAETSGSLIPYEKWSKIDAGAIAFGQGISVSAVQLVSAISAIANNGTLMKPILVKKIISNTGAVKKRFDPVPVKRVVSEKTARNVKQMMLSVVTEEGTGGNAAMDGYSVCGKTGTAQKVAKNGKGYSKNRYTSLFAGFAPRDNPELAVLVIVDEPKKHHYGGVVSAPAFKIIVSQSFQYLNIPPDAGSEKLVAQLSKGA